MGRLADSLRYFFEPLSPAQRTIFAMLAVLVIAFTTAVFYWTLKPEYTLLFGSMTQEAAGEVVNELQSQGVPYRIGENGRSVYVPAHRVHELRMQLASMGFAQSDVQGYELFDANTLGMTDFMQRINKKRALEGELSRTISSLDQVEYSRVHLVLPERGPFQQTTVDATASIILTLQRGQSLSKAQVDGMTALVAGSVEGLRQESITVLDQSGNRLTDGVSYDEGFMSGSMQMQLRQKAESYLTDKGQSMLDRVLGPGNSILRVATEHDFERLFRESDLIDPDSRIIISEERRTDSNTDEQYEAIPFDDMTPISQRSETIVTSTRGNETSVQSRQYEVNKIREQFEKPQGEIRRISASVLLNYKQVVEQDDEGRPMMASQPYAGEEVEELRSVLLSALGMQPDRGDQLTITQIRFFDPTFDEQYRLLMEEPFPWNHLLRWSLILAALLAFAGLMYNMSIRMREEQLPVLFQDFAEGDEVAIRDDETDDSEETPEGADMGQEEEDYYNKKLSTSARRQLKDKSFILEEIREFVDAQPEDAANVVRVLLSAEKKTK